MTKFEKDLARPLFDFIRSSHKAETLDDLNIQFSSVVSDYGFDTFLCTDLRGSTGNGRPVELFGRWNRRWEARYFSRQYFRFDACLEFLKHSNSAFSWSDVLATGTVTSIGRRILDEASEYKAREGVLVPIRSLDRQLSVVSLMGDTVELSDDGLAAIEVASIYFCEAGRRLQHRQSGTKTHALTKRQIEIIKWLAEGKRYGDIATILNISVKTVHRHMDDARTRMNLVTRDQLVLEAFRKGLIEV
ncbi:LuxR family transcriptional regulator [uncultured Algimonas sp.]|uniref:helix-turn-helix transcriptional regulator n=1 Tax=uncultured Algimonas sp. TaxID=1547920 RepID=UPI0026379B30|nr:LuxR family transcriptional regulator [uncultured Algimonas sp.]